MRTVGKKPWPRLYVCFGVPKSGSTLAYQISRAAAVRAGFDQSPLTTLTNETAGPSHADDRFVRILASVEREEREMFVYKTHADPTPSLVEAVRSGTVWVQVHTRDPRDVALSMLDAAHRDDAWGKTHKQEPLQDIDDVKVRLRRLIRRHSAWAELPGALCLHYEHTAFSTLDVARKIAGHMGLPASPLRDTLSAKRRFTQLNKGRSQRHLREMSPEQTEAWYRDFREHIDAYCPAPSGSVWISRLGTQLGQVLRKFS